MVAVLLAELRERTNRSAVTSASFAPTPRHSRSASGAHAGSGMSSQVATTGHRDERTRPRVSTAHGSSRAPMGDTVGRPTTAPSAKQTASAIRVAMPRPAQNEISTSGVVRRPVPTNLISWSEKFPDLGSHSDRGGYMSDNATPRDVSSTQLLHRSDSEGNLQVGMHGVPAEVQGTRRPASPRKSYVSGTSKPLVTRTNFEFPGNTSARANHLPVSKRVQARPNGRIVRPHEPSVNADVRPGTAPIPEPPIGPAEAGLERDLSSGFQVVLTPNPPPERGLAPRVSPRHQQPSPRLYLEPPSAPGSRGRKLQAHPTSRRGPRQSGPWHLGPVNRPRYAPLLPDEGMNSMGFRPSTAPSWPG